MESDGEGHPYGNYHGQLSQAALWLWSLEPKDVGSGPCAPPNIIACWQEFSGEHILRLLMYNCTAHTTRGRTKTQSLLQFSSMILCEKWMKNGESN